MPAGGPAIDPGVLLREQTEPGERTGAGGTGTMAASDWDLAVPKGGAGHPRWTSAGRGIKVILAARDAGAETISLDGRPSSR